MADGTDDRLVSRVTARLWQPTQAKSVKKTGYAYLLAGFGGALWLVWAGEGVAAFGVAATAFGLFLALVSFAETLDSDARIESRLTDLCARFEIPMKTPADGVATAEGNEGPSRDRDEETEDTEHQVAEHLKPGDVEQDRWDETGEHDGDRQEPEVG